MKKGFMMTFALLLVAVGAYYVSGTYARYTEQVTSVGTATIAKWGFTDDNPATFEIKLDETNLDATTLVNERIAPGTTGTFDIAINNATTETAVDVNITIAKENVPTNLKFYTDNTYTTEFSDTGLNATLAAKDAVGLTKTVYWKWVYNETPEATRDENDTTDGKAAGDMTVTLTIVGTQAKPSTTAYTYGWK